MEVLGTKTKCIQTECTKFLLREGVKKKINKMSGIFHSRAFDPPPVPEWKFIYFLFIPFLDVLGPLEHFGEKSDFSPLE